LQVEGFRLQVAGEEGSRFRVYAFAKATADKLGLKGRVIVG